MNFLKRIICFGAVLASIALGGCFTAKHYEKASSKLENSTWVPVYVLGQEGLSLPSTSPEDMEAYLHFTHRGYGRFVTNGKAGVNNFTGSMELREDGSAIFAPLASTMKIGKHYAYEAKFLEALRKARRVEMAGDEMTLSETGPDGTTVLMKLKKAAR